MSRDHVPPASIFPSEKPRNLITVPCCTPCNQDFKQLDQRMRNYVAALAGPNSGDVGDVARMDILRSYKHSIQFLAQMKPHPSLRDDRGEPRHVFFFDRAELVRWMGRIVKGLIFAKTGEILPRECDLRVTPLPNAVIQPSASFPKEEGLEFRPYFLYGKVGDPGDECWILIFYDQLVFRVELGARSTR